MMNAKIPGLLATALTIVSPLAGLAAAAGLAPADDLRSVLASFRGHDRDRDGTAEINAIGPASFEPNPGLIPGSSTRLLLVLLEPRLLQSVAGGYSTGDLVGRLQDYGRHLASDGFTPYFATADVYRGSRHQDGLTLLAMRDVLQEVRRRAPALQGVILIGSFPEAMLVRRWVWRTPKRATIGGVTYNGSGGPSADLLWIDPEVIAERSDIVLADLDGNWDRIYQRGPVAIDHYAAIPDSGAPSNWPQGNQILTCSRYRHYTVNYEDCFFIDDALYTVYEQSSARLRICASPATRRPEVGWNERFAANPIARPDIGVSRINPLHVGVAQDSAVLDGNGYPTVAVVTNASQVNHLFRRDPATERQLLVEYLDRNLAHRVGARKADGFRAAWLRTDPRLDLPVDFVSAASGFGSAVAYTDATAVDLVRFMKTPALLKAICAHSNAAKSDLIAGYDQSVLGTESGGRYWYWSNALAPVVIPTYDHDHVRNIVGFSLLRTLWKNRTLRNAGPCFFVHQGCQANSVPNAMRTPYSASDYAGHQQLAENFLFYGNGLAILSRAKVFYDAAEGFADTLRRPGARFGDVLPEYARISSADAARFNDVAGYDRTYFWSILGDWTLRLDYTHSRDQSVATLYTHGNFGGHSISLPVGRYDLALLEHSIGNDVLSSLSVTPGFQVRLFYHDRFRSQGALVRGNTASLGVMNDQTSSLIVEPVNQGGVRLFQHQGYQGASVALDVGLYDVNTLVNTIGNDQLTSLTVQPGYEVRLFYHSRFVGGPLVLRSSISHLGSWNDIVSSLAIIRVP